MVRGRHLRGAAVGWHHHENSTDSDSILFSVDDWPALKALDLYREEGKAD